MSLNINLDEVHLLDILLSQECIPSLFVHGYRFRSGLALVEARHAKVAITDHVDGVRPFAIGKSQLVCRDIADAVLLYVFFQDFINVRNWFKSMDMASCR